MSIFEIEVKRELGEFILVSYFFFVLAGFIPLKNFRVLCDVGISSILPQNESCLFKFTQGGTHLPNRPLGVFMFKIKNCLYGVNLILRAVLLLPILKENRDFVISADASTRPGWRHDRKSVFS